MRANRDQRNTTENTKSSANTKRALIQSMIALFSCCLLLIGATYAWFTDTINTVNTIQAGNLDLEVTKKNTTTNAYDISVTDATELFDADFNWEPGVAQVVQLKVENAGDMSLAYKIGARMLENKKGTNMAGEEFYLADYIKFAIVEEELDLATLGRSGVINAAENSGNARLLSALADTSAKEATETTAKTLAPNDANYVTLVAYMPESVGNEANNDGVNRPYVKFGVDFKATQVNSEKDYFGTDYDTSASGTLNNMDNPDKQEANPTNPANPAFEEISVVDPLASFD